MHVHGVAVCSRHSAPLRTHAHPNMLVCGAHTEGVCSGTNRGQKPSNRTLSVGFGRGRSRLGGLKIRGAEATSRIVDRQPPNLPTGLDLRATRIQTMTLTHSLTLSLSLTRSLPLPLNHTGDDLDSEDDTAVAKKQPSVPYIENLRTHRWCRQEMTRTRRTALSHTLSLTLSHSLTLSLSHSLTL